MEKICEICNKKFNIRPSRYNKTHCCSLECRKIYLSKKYIGENNPNYKGKFRICKECGKQYPYRSKENLKFCSRDCYAKYMVCENNPNWSGGKNKCKECGKVISSGVKRCKSCAHKGSRNNNWKGGKSNEKYSFDFDNALRKIIRKRDNYTCKYCNKKEKLFKRKLTVHHIDNDKLNNNPNNLISLCNVCHALIHRNNIKIK